MVLERLIMSIYLFQSVLSFGQSLYVWSHNIIYNTLVHVFSTANHAVEFGRVELSRWQVIVVSGAVRHFSQFPFTPLFEHGLQPPVTRQGFLKGGVRRMVAAVHRAQSFQDGRALLMAVIILRRLRVVDRDCYLSYRYVYLRHVLPIGKFKRTILFVFIQTFILVLRQLWLLLDILDWGALRFFSDRRIILELGRGSLKLILDQNTVGIRVWIKADFNAGLFL